MNILLNRPMFHGSIHSTDLVDQLSALFINQMIKPLDDGNVD